MRDIAGVIYPIPLELVSRIFAEQKKVFVKYVAHETCTGLAPKNKILFYASHGQKEIVGEAIIETIEFLTPIRVLEKYGDNVFLNRDELMEYASQQPSRTISKKMVVLVLSKPKRYARGINYEKPITMAGEYLTKERYNALFQEIRKERGETT